MAVDLSTELIESRRVVRTKDGLKSERVWLIDTPNPEDAIQILPRYGDPHPAIYGLYVEDVKIDPLESESLCKLTVTYGPRDADPRANEFGEVWEFGFGVQQVHITSVPTSGRQRHFPLSSNTGTAIGVDSDRVNGVDVQRPCLTARVTVRREFVTNDFRRGITDRVSKINSGPFLRWDAGEVLFSGCDIRPMATRLWEVQFNFQIAKRQPSFEVELINGTTVGPIEAGPWDHVWFTHVETISEQPDGNGGTIQVKRNGIESVHVAQIYDDDSSYDFNFFGLRG